MLRFFWIAWAAVLFGSLIFLTPQGPLLVRIPPLARMLSSFILVVAAWWRCHQIPSERQVWALMAVGMTFGLLGDLCLADWIIPLDVGFLGGMGAFALGHIAYLLGVYRWGRDRHRLSPPPWWRCWAVWGALCLPVWYLVVLRETPHREFIHWASGVYTLLLAGTAAFTLALALRSREMVWLAVGGALFVISDIILGAQLFHPSWFHHLPPGIRGDIVWILYGTGQMGILFGFRARSNLNS